MDNDARSYRVICFDLDGTLLPMDIDEFMSDYFRRIAAYAAEHGLDAELFMKALKLGTQAMTVHDDDRLNKDVFWEEFAKVYGPTDVDVQAMADRFYEDEFGHIGDGFEGNPAAARVIAELQAKGYPVVLATMPLFPLRAVKHRLDWAGVDPDAFSRITNYANSKAAKPRQTYYAENLAAMGVNGEDVLMVGNNTMEDLSFLDLGVDAYLVTDWLLDPVDFDMDTVRHGTFDEFEKWVGELPPCTDPATGITDGPVSRMEMEKALADNAVVEIDMEVVNANSKALAEAIGSDHVPGTAAKLKGIKA